MLSVPPTFNCAETIRLIGQRCRFDRERLPVSITVKHASIFAKKFSPLFFPIEHGFVKPRPLVFRINNSCSRINPVCKNIACN